MDTPDTERGGGGRRPEAAYCRGREATDGLGESGGIDGSGAERVPYGRGCGAGPGRFKYGASTFAFTHC